VEIFIAGCAMLVWANTGPGVLHSLAYNMVFIASVSTILFNINPLLRFDGYYILSDLLDIPNLHAQASGHLKHLVERYIFGYKKSQSPAANGKEAFWFTFFGILSSAYRVVVFTSILLFVADRFLLLGIIMAAVCAVSWLIVPFLKLIRYLATSPRLERTRLRAVAICAGFLVGVFALLYLIPFPDSFKAPGVVEATEHAIVVNNVEGYIDSVAAQSGSRVQPGDELVKLENSELQFQIRETEAHLKEVQAVRQQAMLRSQADVKSVDSLIRSIERQLERLYTETELLTVRAEIQGVWVAPELEDLEGMWVHRGTALGQLIDDRSFHFASVVSQQDTSQLFSGQIRDSEVKLRGQSDVSLAVASLTAIPVEQSKLPSMALGFGAGGDIAVDTADATGTSTVEPFYEVRLEVMDTDEVTMYHGRSGRVRFKLGLEPLLQQWYRKLRQLLQERYQI
jgi:putative peptide zinc metalloprotease protein